MMLVKYIDDLLYRYDCVIIPDFGGFVTNTSSAFIDSSVGIIHPPLKKVSFNSNLIHNDGLLANYIASSKNISFEQASSAIKKEVENWKKQITEEVLLFNNIGAFTLNNEGKIIFEPSNQINFLTTSFGLSSTNSSMITRKVVEQEKPVFDIDTVKVAKTTDKTSSFWIKRSLKYGAVASVILVLGIGIFENYRLDKQKKVVINQQTQLENKIQEATFVIGNPLPEVDLKVKKVSAIDYSYHIVAGAFQSQENAEKKVKMLQRKGFKSSVIGKNKWGLIQVSFSSFDDEELARKALKTIQKKESKEAWLLIK